MINYEKLCRKGLDKYDEEGDNAYKQASKQASKQGITALFSQIAKLNIIKESKAYSARFRTGRVRPFYLSSPLMPILQQGGE